MMRSVLTALLFGLLEGVSEWLPISSTGHLILLEQLLDPGEGEAFAALFEVVIQLGAILAVPILVWSRLNPLSRGKSAQERRQTLALWGKVALATLPCALIGPLLDDFLEAHLHTPLVVGLALIVYGVAFLLPTPHRKGGAPLQAEQIGVKTALGVGLFQVLSLLPGTSRSGATILGGLWLGLARPAAAEFSFFLGIPTMLGAGLLRTVKFFLDGGALSPTQVLLLALGTLTAFLVSLAVIRFLMDFVRRHSFAPFGVYRIVLGALVLLFAL